MEHKEFNGRGRSWLVTWFADPSEFDIKLDVLRDVVLFFIGQIEKCPTTNREHLQIFLNYAQPIRHTAIQKILKGAHCEIAKFTDKSIEYCTKEDTRVRGPYQYGTDPRTRMLKGKKLTVREALTANEEQLQDLDCYSYNVVKKALLNVPRIATGSDDVRGLWIVGPPGVGKSRFARNEYPGAYIKAQTKWWDGYNGEEAVLLDDFDLLLGSKEAQEYGHHLKIWADRYPCYGEIKGGTVALCHKKFIITSNYSPDDIWPSGVMLIAIERRFNLKLML